MTTDTEFDDRYAASRERKCATAWAIKVNGQWFAGFGGKPGQEELTKFRPGLWQAKLLRSPEERDEYLGRLFRRGHFGRALRVFTADETA